MNDFYTEQLVKRKTTGASIVIKAVMLALTIVSFLISLVIPFGMLLPVILIAADVFVFRSQDLEFEYLYVNGDLDIDKIMGRAKRKTVFSASISEIEFLAPAGAGELNQFKVNKTLNYSSLVPGKKTYELIVLKSGEKIKVIFEPNDVILNGYKMLLPRKVII